jgi:hypothetical protein
MTPQERYLADLEALVQHFRDRLKRGPSLPCQALVLAEREVPEGPWEEDVLEGPANPGDVINWQGHIASADPMFAFESGSVLVTLQQAEVAREHGWRTVAEFVADDHQRLCLVER